MRFEIGLYKDAMTPSIQALILENNYGGVRLTSAKGCGSWKFVKLFVCEVDMADLDEAEIGPPVKATARARG